MWLEQCLKGECFAINAIIYGVKVHRMVTSPRTPQRLHMEEWGNKFRFSRLKSVAINYFPTLTGGYNEVSFKGDPDNKEYLIGFKTL